MDAHREADGSSRALPRSVFDHHSYLCWKLARGWSVRDLAPYGVSDACDGTDSLPLATQDRVFNHTFLWSVQKATASPRKRLLRYHLDRQYSRAGRFISGGILAGQIGGEHALAAPGRSVHRQHRGR